MGPLYITPGSSGVSATATSQPCSFPMVIITYRFRQTREENSDGCGGQEVRSVPAGSLHRRQAHHALPNRPPARPFSWILSARMIEMGLFLDGPDSRIKSVPPGLANMFRRQLATALSLLLLMPSGFCTCGYACDAVPVESQARCVAGPGPAAHHGHSSARPHAEDRHLQTGHPEGVGDRPCPAPDHHRPSRPDCPVLCCAAPSAALAPDGPPPAVELHTPTPLFRPLPAKAIRLLPFVPERHPVPPLFISHCSLLI